MSLDELEVDSFNFDEDEIMEEEVSLKRKRVKKSIVYIEKPDR